ncbi:MAG: J domain-containing protein [Cyanothece sp. SIO1E1]|nr:J domain-containing protein [Cyanothece sp. SIO1E1]
MAQDRQRPGAGNTQAVNNQQPLGQKGQSDNYYSLLGLVPSASAQQIRRAYRDMSKLYHPDTTELSPAMATVKFQKLNDAYATLSNPERRLAYDRQIGYSRISVMQAPLDLNHSPSQSRLSRSSSAYLDPTDRPLSAGEVFALFILGLTFVACLVLVLTVGLTRGELTIKALIEPNTIGTGSPIPPAAEIQPLVLAPLPTADISPKLESDVGKPVFPPISESQPVPATQPPFVIPSKSSIEVELEPQVESKD